LIVFIPCVLSLYSIGMAMSSVFLKAGRAFEYYLGLADEPIQFITGSYFPIFSQNVLLAVFGSIIPLTLGIDGLRQVLVDGEYVSPLNWQIEALIMLIYWFLGLKLAKKSLSWMEKLAREKGTLTLRWQ
jgi:ABC-type polysaccharide/polyol phosphate export permease